MINLDRFELTEEYQHPVLPPDHPYMRGLTINQPIYDQDLQWRLKIQQYSAQCCFVTTHQPTYRSSKL